MSRTSSLACALLYLGPERGTENSRARQKQNGQVPEQLEMIGQVVKQEWRPWLKPLIKNTKLAFKILSQVFDRSKEKNSLLAKEKKINLWATDQPTDQQFAVPSLVYRHMSRSDHFVFQSVATSLTHVHSAGHGWPTSGIGSPRCLLLDCAGPTIMLSLRQEWLELARSLRPKMYKALCIRFSAMLFCWISHSRKHLEF